MRVGIYSKATDMGEENYISNKTKREICNRRGTYINWKQCRDQHGPKLPRMKI